MSNQQVTVERGRGDDAGRSFIRHPLTTLQHEIDRVFGDFFPSFDLTKFRDSTDIGALVPKIDFSESDASYELAVEVPGVADKDLEVSVKNGVLKIKGEKKKETEEKTKDFIRTERTYGSYCRAMALPEDADEPKITAKYVDGVLRIVMPKSPEAKSKSHKIEIRKS
jgi:HSP20 family protein